MNRRSFLGLAAISLASTACGAPVARGLFEQPSMASTIAPNARPDATSAQAQASPIATSMARTQSVPDTTDRLLIRDGAGTSASIVAIDAARGDVAYRMPAGLPLTRGAHRISLLPADGRTTISVRRTSDGATTQSFTVPGEFGEAALSHDNGLLLLMQPMAGTTPPKTPMAVVDIRSGDVIEQAQLDGKYLPDTVSPDGSTIYLVELHPERKANAYQVALYDRAQHRVVGKIADKRSAQTIMSGQKVTHVWSRSGEWLYSLYLDPGSGGDGAFVHALNVKDRFAICIDLPSHGPEEVLRHYALVRTPSDDVVYATNPALGVINYWHVGEFDARGVPFTMPAIPVPGATGASDGDTAYRAGTRSYNNSVMSADGTTLYIGSDRGIIRTGSDARAQKSDLWLPGRAVSSLGMSPSGKVLYALIAQPRAQLVALDARDGSQIGDLSGLVAQPAGIEQVTASS